MSEHDATDAVTALVVVRAGGPALRATLASLVWAGRRCIVDPARVLSPATTPEDVEPWEPTRASGWVLLLVEGERADDGLLQAVRAATREAARAYRIAVECHGFGGVIRLVGRPVRLARGAAPGLGVTLGGEIGFVTPHASQVLTGAAIIRALDRLPTEAVDALNAEATVLAALAAAAGVHPRLGRLVASGFVGGGRALCGRGRGRLGWGRWIVAILGGYRALLAEAKLWERAQHDVGWPRR